MLNSLPADTILTSGRPLRLQNDSEVL